MIMKRRIILLIGIALLIPTLQMKGAMVGNWSCMAYEGGCYVEDGEKKFGQTIGQVLIEDALNFMESHSRMIDFLIKIENTDINNPKYLAFSEILDAIIEKMEKARSNYYELNNMVADMKYNQGIILKLMSFNYSKFEQENGLIPTIFREIEGLLNKGDVKGVYLEFFLRTDEILKNLYEVKKEIDSHVFPKFSTLWEISQNYLEMQLFGQFVSEIFYEIKESRSDRNEHI
jgi:hypothetical protein